jgi:acetyl-CoA carboxylase/biotin carboxylase 1
MEDAAVRLAREVNYVSAGTVEYLYFGGEYYFLELNPRLQVEHPVTEMITGVNLPACQLQVAMGIPLGKMPDVRCLYGLDPVGSVPLDVATAPRPSPKGHVVAVRITAENPETGFKPTSGQIRELTFNSTPNVWGYFSVGSAGGGLHEYADSQFGHIFSWAENRTEALAGMVVALKEVSIRGDIRTPVEFLVEILETDAIRNNTFHNAWLDQIIASEVTSERADPVTAILCAAAYSAHRAFAERAAEAAEHVRRGQGVPAELLSTAFETDLVHDNLRYSITAMRTGELSVDVRINGSNLEIEVRKLSDGGFLISFDGKSRVVYPKDDVAGLRLLIDGRTSTFPHDRDPTRVVALSPGKLVRFLVSDGTHVSAGAAFAEMEVMKMFMPMVAAEAGRITFCVPEGTILCAGDVVASLQLDDPSKVKRPSPFTGELVGLTSVADLASRRVDQVAIRIGVLASNVLRGHCADGPYGRKSFQQHCTLIAQELSRCVRDPALPRHRISELLSNVSSHLPSELLDEIDAVLAAHEARLAADEENNADAAAAGGAACGDVSAAAAAAAAAGAAVADGSAGRGSADGGDAASEVGGGSSGGRSVASSHDADEARRNLADARTTELGGAVVDAIAAFRASLPNEDAVREFDRTVAAVEETAAGYRDDPRRDVETVFAPLLDLYLDVEEAFGSATLSAEETFAVLRERHGSDCDTIVRHLISHARLPLKNTLVRALLRIISKDF